MDLSAITSTDIPQLVRGHNAASNGEPFDEDESDLWKAAFLLHPKSRARTAPVIPFPTKDQK